MSCHGLNLSKLTAPHSDMSIFIMESYETVVARYCDDSVSQNV
jgi:23S rRNA pseudoU1915 N3-methylase RlmH